jgi:hypothetical protein
MTQLTKKINCLGADILKLHPCEHSRIQILQWILTKLGTYLVFRRVWNPIDFQGHRSKAVWETTARQLMKQYFI